MIKYLTLYGVGRYIGVAKNTIEKYSKDGRLPQPDAFIEGKQNKYLWLPDTIDRWNKARPGHGGRPPKTGGKDRFRLKNETFG